MIYFKQYPIGIDVVINDIQKAISNALTWSGYNAYHRAYKNYSRTGAVPEVFKVQDQAKAGEYMEVLLDDNLNASSFFYVADTILTTDNGNLVTTTLSFVCQVDLAGVTGVQNARNDEEVHATIIRAINKNANYGKVSSLVTGIPAVYTDFDISKISLDDMQPFHCFRIDIGVNYLYDCSVSEVNVPNEINGNQVILF